MYNFLLGAAFTKSSAGWIFEGCVHACLRRGGTFKIRSLGTNHGVLQLGIKMGEKTSGNLRAMSELCGERKVVVAEAKCGGGGRGQWRGLF